MLEKEIINFEKSIIVGIVTQNQSEEMSADFYMRLNKYLSERNLLLKSKPDFSLNDELFPKFILMSEPL